MRIAPLFLPCVIAVTPVLRQVHVITRHGSRETLSRNLFTLTETTAQQQSQLTELGKIQMKRLGAFLKTRYGSHLDIRKSTVRLESSDYDRTIASASALSAGLIDDVSIVRTIPEQHDIYMRAFDKCPTFHDGLEQLRKTRKWKQLQEDGILITMGLSFPELKVNGRIPLEKAWDLYDTWNVLRIECAAAANSTACDPQRLDKFPREPENTFERFETLAHKAEVIKYSNSRAGDLVGRNLLLRIRNDVLFRQSTAVHVHSAHYPTLLGILSALHIHLPTKEMMPGYAAAILVDVYDTDQVVVLYKQSEDDDSLVELCNDGTTKKCNILQQSGSFPSWCEACGNKHADVCVQHLLQQESESCRTRTAILFFVGLGMGFCVALVAAFCQAKKRRKRRVDRKESSNAEPTDRVHDVVVEDLPEDETTINNAIPA